MEPKVAIEGCCHAELDAIYGTVAEADRLAGRRTDLLLICGDFQAIRNDADLSCLAVPQKYRRLGEFHRYYGGQVQAPVFTVIIGGNHEASNYMWELYHGGWVAPNIYYLGCAGSILVNGLRISGASGIFKSHDYSAGHHERMPYDNATMRSIYHIRQYDVYRLSLLRLSPPMIFLSHDWPLSIERYGDLDRLLRAKPFFADEVRENRLGSPPLLELLRVLRPAYWFAAHLHVRFPALFKHDEASETLLRGRSIDMTSVRSQRATNHYNANQVPLGARKSGDTVEAIVGTDAVENPEEIEIDLDLADQADASVDESVDVQQGRDLIAAAMADDPPLSHPNALTPQVTTNGHADENEIVIDEEDGVDAPVALTENNPDEIDLGMSDGEGASREPEAAARPASIFNTAASETRFLALSKCLPGKDFLQILEFPTPESHEPVQATLDPLWLAITRAFLPYLSLERRPATPLPTDENVMHGLVERELSWIRANLPNRGEVRLTEAQQFVKTAPAPDDAGGRDRGPPPWYTNPQTEAFCKLIGVENRINAAPPAMKAV